MPEHPGFVVVANAAAGSADRATVERATGRLAAVASAAVRWTEDEDELDDAIATLDGRTLVVAGGDGSLHVALNAVRRGDHTDGVGVLPLGTGNDFARNHGVPLDPDAAVEAIVGGRPTPVDAIRTGGGEWIANNAHLGLGVEAAETAATLKSSLGRLAYPLGTLYRAARPEVLTIAVGIDGAPPSPERFVALMVLMGPSVGGGTEVVPDDGPRMEVVTVDAPRPRDRLRLGLAFVRGRHLDHPGLRRRPVRRVELAADRLTLDVDGDVRSFDDGLTLELEPDAWSVLLAPAGSG